MWRSIQLSLLCQVISATIPGSNLDFFELDQIKYAIAIDGHPVRIDEVATSDDAEDQPLVVPMTNKFGQKYHCLVPDLSVPKRSQTQGDEKLSLGQFQTAVYKAVGDMTSKSQSCLIYTRDWWTYELCPYTTIKQYHLEDGKILGNTLILGEFSYDYNWKDEDRQKENSLMYHSQFYEDGTICDITKKPRKTEVRYYCEPGFMRDIIYQVNEPQSCEYVIKVGTRKLCDIPDLRPKKKDEPSEIKCHPALTEEEFKKYEAYEEDKKALAEIRKKQAKEKQKEKMLKVLGDNLPKDVDINTDDGFQIIENMVEEKMADQLVSELEKYLTPGSLSDLGSLTTGLSLKKIFTEDMFGEAKSKYPSLKQRFFEVIQLVLQRIETKKAYENEDQSATFDLEMERKVRSDVVSEEEMLDELQKTLTKIGQGESSILKDSKEFQKRLQASIEDIVKETEKELGTKLDGHSQEQLNKFNSNLKDLMNKLDKAESEIKRVNDEISKVQDTIDKDELELQDLEEAEGLDLKRDGKKSVKKELRDGAFEKYEQELRDLEEAEGLDLKRDGTGSVKKVLRDEDFDKVTKLEMNDDDEDEDLESKEGEAEINLKRDGTRSVKKELREDEHGESLDSPFRDGSENVQVKVDQVSATQISGLRQEGNGNAMADSVGNKVTKRLESVIKEKLAKAGLDTGGRSIEVKLVTTSSFNLDEDGEEESLLGSGLDENKNADMSHQETLQFQDMIHNLMTGNQKGYDEIDNQRKSERNYKFQWKDELLEKAEQLLSKSQINEPVNKISEKSEEEK